MRLSSCFVLNLACSESVIFDNLYKILLQLEVIYEMHKIQFEIFYILMVCLVLLLIIELILDKIDFVILDLIKINFDIKGVFGMV